MRLQEDRPFLLLVLCALLALGIAAGFILNRSDTTFVGYETDGSYGSSFADHCPSSAWDYTFGSYFTPKPSSDDDRLDVRNLEAANTACLNVVHQRQNWSLLLVVVAAGLGVGAAFRARTVVRGRSSPNDTAANR
jgi:hypothetical protein